MLIWKTFILASTALLPLINPIGSALIFLGLVGDRTDDVYRKLAGQIALATFVFLILVEFGGSAVLRFFGISLPIVQVTGGVVIAATAWGLLFEPDADSLASDKQDEVAGSTFDERLHRKIFYPFTFPITAGPGTMVAMLTISAHAAEATLLDEAAIHVGITLAALAMAVLIYFSYAYAPRLVATISPATAHGILRVVAFFLMCIGAQVAWSGFVHLH
jgi:multiple antibiotic resistance protein